MKTFVVFSMAIVAAQAFLLPHDFFADLADRMADFHRAARPPSLLPPRREIFDDATHQRMSDLYESLTPEEKAALRDHLFGIRFPRPALPPFHFRRPNEEPEASEIEDLNSEETPKRSKRSIEPPQEFEGMRKRWESIPEEKRHEIMEKWELMTEEEKETFINRHKMMRQEWESMPEEKKQKIKEKWQSMTKEEKKAFMIRRKVMHEMWEAMPKEKKQEIKEKWQSMSQEEKEAFISKRKFMNDKWESMATEKKEEILEKWNSMTKEEKENFMNKRIEMRQKWKNIPEEKKQEIKQKWQSMTQEEKEAFKNQRKHERTPRQLQSVRPLPEFFDGPVVRPAHHRFEKFGDEKLQAMRQKWENMSEDKKQEIKEKWQSMNAEEKEAFMNKRRVMRQKWEAMSEEKKQEIMEKWQSMTQEEKEAFKNQRKSEFFHKTPRQFQPMRPLPEFFETPAVRPAQQKFDEKKLQSMREKWDTMLQDRREEMFKMWSSMTSEQKKEAIRTKWQQMTPEEKEAFRNEKSPRQYVPVRTLPEFIDAPRSIQTIQPLPEFVEIAPASFQKPLNPGDHRRPNVEGPLNPGDNRRPNKPMGPGGNQRPNHPPRFPRSRLLDLSARPQVNYAEMIEKMRGMTKEERISYIREIFPEGMPIRPLRSIVDPGYSRPIPEDDLKMQPY